MRHRVFVAINLPEDVKKQLESYQSKWLELPVRWVKKENLHITLIFLGYLSDQDLVEVCRAIKDVSPKHPAFFINLKRVCYGPPQKKPYSEMKSLTGRLDKVENRPPRMIWVEGEKLKELALLKDDLEKSLAGGGVHFLSENRQFAPHITLGRIKSWEWRQIEPEERPEIDEEINLSFPVNSLEVMESQLKRGGSEYTILESAPLGEKII